MAGGHGGGHAPKSSGNHGGGGLNLGAGPGILGFLTVVAASVIAILGG